GGRGTILGTVLGLLAIVVLQNGLRLSAQPVELTGILTGVLLLVTITLSRWSGKFGFTGGQGNRFSIAGDKLKFGGQSSEEEIDVKNSQVAVLSTVILGAALIVAGSNWWLARSLSRGSNGAAAGTTPASSVSGNSTGRRIQVAMMPKAK